MIERDILFIMLAKNKCMDAFQMLKSVHFPPYSHLSQSQYEITETSQWNTTLSHDTGRVCNSPHCWVFQPHVSVNKGGSAVCMRAKALSLSPSLCKLKRPPTLWRKAAHRCQEPCKALPICWVYLGRDANKKPNRTRYTEGVDSVGKWTHLVEGGNGLHQVTWNTQTDLIFFIELPPKCHH